MSDKRTKTESLNNNNNTNVSKVLQGRVMMDLTYINNLQLCDMWHVNEMHLWNDAVMWIETFKLGVVDQNLVGQISNEIFHDSWAKHSVNNPHHHQKVLPVRISFRIYITNDNW